jgi:hypothetical protein
MVTKEIGSVAGLLALYEEELFSFDQLKKDLETYDKEKLVDYIVSGLANNDRDDGDDTDELL